MLVKASNEEGFDAQKVPPCVLDWEWQDKNPDAEMSRQRKEKTERQYLNLEELNKYPGIV